MDILDTNPTQPHTRKNQLVTMSNMSQMSKQGIEEEFVVDKEEIINFKCSICQAEPCTNYDKKGKPVCKSCHKSLEENRKV